MEYWETENRSGLFIAGYKNPPTNYFIAAAATEFLELLKTWRQPEVKVIVLSGAVKDRFITHYSVEELVEMAENPEVLEASAHGMIHGYHTMLSIVW
jgi:enoyl-CoA hydratase/carnithine racemase